ncbi:hypothetical protein P153DRAFT_385310 [Dothidotthia symphoricarpi CBS 119687]|uniref:Nephrocystin 3-like N-terminal domain-containing protein n=1 Tax=Dothidotthia symphoricarpi CBS 119687 TaxID=1392245 RepID=A0A6A6AGM5_9PLEO|nr:uncharacterized protein P153DRAFT_385310 [Dothidotthia symphoricarpi CBS 119687]KAF2130074.1 hypothetical protein P153DRAFT_385310 [Dothidotthia symphoricarpi CBS 119687]
MNPDEEYFSDENGDVFAREAIVHPALRESSAIAPDIYMKFFDGFFDDPLFDRWLQHKELWQLDVVGGPGAGKSTFAALAAKRIHKARVETTGHHIYLATIFVAESLIENDLAFIEDLLRSVYHQITPLHVEIGPGVLAKYRDYKSAKHHGRKTSARISLISQALRERVAEINANGQAFLVLDNLDQSNASLRELIRRELSELQSLGLKIMSTSRLPRYEAIGDKVCNWHDEPFETSLYWHCHDCRQDICETCKGDDQFCRTCEPASVWTQPEFFTVFIHSIHPKTMAELIAWDLEREHGDLGFGTLADPLEPPLSSFGLAFRNTMTSHAGCEWIQKIAKYVGGSVVQAKLALDRIHNSTSPDLVDLRPKRLPANVQAIFNEGINAINKRSDSWNRIALKSIAVVGKTGDVFDGLTLSALAMSLKERRHRTSSSHVPPRSVEDILEAGQGYLRLNSSESAEDEPNIVTFHRLFHIFTKDEYNEELLMAYSELRTSNIPRSFTHKPKKVEELAQGTSWADMIEGLKGYRSPSLDSMTGLRSPPPMRRESSGLIRSHTFFPSTNATVSPSSGLGLDVFGGGR